MLAWNLNLQVRFRFKFSSRPAGILFPLKVVLLVLIILIIISSRFGWTLHFLYRNHLLALRNSKSSWGIHLQKMAASFICASSSWYTWISASSVHTLVGWSAVVSAPSSMLTKLFQEGCLHLVCNSRSWDQYLCSFFFSYILKKLSVDQTMCSQHATFINLHLISFKIKLFFSHRLMTLPLFHPSPLLLMASIEEPQLMLKLFPLDPWVRQLESHRVAIGSASLRQDCSSGCDL